MKKDNIFLIGFMGSGKSTVLQELVLLFPEYLSVEMDSIIEKQEKRSISDIFAANGEEYFRQCEQQLLEDIVIYNRPALVSTGGGIVINDKHRELLKKNGLVVWLAVSAEKIYERIKDETHRPLLNTHKSKTEIISDINLILDKRFEWYKDSADLIINTDDLSPLEIAQEIQMEHGRLS